MVSRDGRDKRNRGIAGIVMVLFASMAGMDAFAARREPEALAVPAPRPAVRPPRLAPAAPGPVPLEAPVQRRVPTANAGAQAERLAAVNAVRSWGYQLANLDVAKASASPYDLLVLDATTGLGEDRALLPGEVTRLKRKPDGKRRLVVSYLSIGEAEDYRPDYFSREYMEEEAPDWLLSENPQWKGNRLIRFCAEGWQRTILGDDQGRNAYNEIEPSPLYRLIELGLDGVYLDRVDVYSEVAKHCPDAERKMVEFVVRLSRHARRANPNFVVILQNAEELLRHKAMIDAIDAVAKEDLFYGVDHSERANDPVSIRDSVANLKRAKSAGRPVFVIDYVSERALIAEARRKIMAEGFIPYIGPRDLARLWLPGADF